jgi:hypothetical protein
MYNPVGGRSGLKGGPRGCEHLLPRLGCAAIGRDAGRGAKASPMSGECCIRERIKHSVG